MFNISKFQKFWLILSGFIIAFGIGSLIIFGLNLGIDFKGGAIIELGFSENYDIESAKSVVVGQRIANFQLQTTENNGLIIKTENLEKGQYDELLAQLNDKVGNFEERRYDSIGPVIGQELKSKAIYQLLLVSLGIVLYLAYAFRKVSKPATPWRFGMAAIIALFHDLLFVLGVFALLGRFKGVEIDSMFVTAMLTVLGFSVHDTIVVFDRVRENLKKHSGRGMEFVVNHSVSQTVVRSLNTSLAVLFVLLALLLFGGETIKYFVLTLFVGVSIGTYSSIFVASPLLIFWSRDKFKKS
ncbi:MAG: protein translocase subunit SecF [Candidatus Doudnabacteria bacterium CG10_big_fil_rev_8_21_14_0_10_42_18]|uniref:Protein-export membrane protein SecF n=1 Tax=Candidatus Doudnabacteria bacterium CG10_big_fil_rev_8_21_14_0_10_42_18 TaxID=1974552 RepID=A0A2H0VAY6_9BACT|nr:MAG: protein translocase subunit SecF [Candidatus Doudnabacteria bacterium CG10_big_fil_rev_8_21_14_0_10_42_18]